MNQIFLFWGMLWLCASMGSAQAQVPDSLAAIPNDSVRALAIGKLAVDIAFEKREFTTADQLLVHARTINTTVGSDYVRARLLRDAGIIEQAREDNPAALLNLQKAYEGFKKIDNPKMQVDALTRLQQVYFSEKEFQLAEKYALQALDIFQQNPSLPLALLGDCYNELANIYGEKGNQPKSLKYINLARTTYQKSGDENSVQTANFNSAITLRKLGRFTESIARFKEVEAFARRTKDDYMLLFVSMNLPKTLMALGNYDEALRLNSQALAMVQSNTSLHEFSFLKNIHSNFHELYAAQNEYKSAYEHYKLAAQYGDSLTDLEKKREIARLETQFSTRQKEEKIEELGDDNRAKQQQLLILFTSLGGMAVLLIGLMWQYQRLQRSKATISAQSDQLKVLMKELHHRVKNNLAIVSSLLKLQSNRIEDESAAKAVREGQQRVEAMSLIHQRLYQTDDRLTSINMREYVLDLTENLMLAYGYALDNFDLRLNIEQEELDVDLAIPVGLILNELLTNSFKYAYEHVQTPMLSISLTGKQGVTLEIKDNGPGINELQWKQKGGSFGKRLIKNLSEQTGGEYHIGTDNGTCYKLHIAEQVLRKVA
jgi:two-component sensor histidine kinase